MSLHNSTFQQAEEYHFMFQKGMYLSERFEIQDAVVLYSDIVEDFFWNYATRIQTTTSRLSNFVNSVAEFLRKKNRGPCFYLTDRTQPKKELQTLLNERRYSPQFQDAWMFFDPSLPEASKKLTAATHKVNVETVSEPTDFIKVFAGAYGGEPTEDEPYGGLPDYYIKALKRSFDIQRDVFTFHFVAYTSNEDPVAISTLVYKNGWGAIYNVGTLPAQRGKGLGSVVSRACIEKWSLLGGRTLFLQTEVGSKVQSWYKSMGFVTRFIGEGWALTE